MMKNFFLKYYAELTGLFVFLIYLTTLSPTVTEFDSGELITVQATLGIAHPTGYPLFTIVGYLFSQIPLPMTIAQKLNLLCAIWCALTIIFFVKTVKIIFDNIKLFGCQHTEYFSNDDTLKKIAAISSGLILAFSYTFWVQATKVEVYSFQLFLSSIIIYWALKTNLKPLENTIGGDPKILKGWFITALFVGLAFANHMMTIFLLPFLIILFFSQNKFNVKSIKQFFGLVLIVFTVSTIVYIYLLISAGYGSGLNIWMQPNFADWIDHIRAKVYQSFFADSINEISTQLKAFGESITPQLARESRRGGDFSINIILIAAGLILSSIMLRKLILIIGSILAVAFLFSISYGILDIQEYFLLIFYGFAIFWSVAVFFIISLEKISKRLAVSLLVPALLISIQVLNNYKEVDRSDNYLFEDYVLALLNSMDKNSLLITNQWDTIESPGFYFQKVEGRRKDIEIVNLELISFKSYKLDLKKNYNISSDDSLNVVNIDYLLNSFNTYIASEVIRDYLQEQRLILNGSINLVPDILAFKIAYNNEYIPAKDPDFKLRIPEYRSVVDEHIINLVCTMLVNRIKYELDHGKTDRAKVFYKKLTNDFPMFKSQSNFTFLAESNIQIEKSKLFPKSN